MEIEKQQCECCGKYANLHDMIIDREDANWYCAECVAEFNSDK